MYRVDVKMHQSNYCIFSSYQISDLKLRTRRRNPEKLFKCNQCNYEGNQRTTLDSHIWSTHNNLLYQCELCEHKTSKKKISTDMFNSSMKEKYYLVTMIVNTSQRLMPPSRSKNRHMTESSIVVISVITKQHKNPTSKFT